MKEVDIDFYKKELDFYRKEQQKLERIENDIFWERYKQSKERSFVGKVSRLARRMAFGRNQQRRADALKPLIEQWKANEALYKGSWRPDESWWDYELSKLNKERLIPPYQ